MKRLLLICLTICLAYSVNYGQSEKDKEIISEAQKAKAAFIKKDDGMAKFFNSSVGYVIFPNVGKGGLGVGGASGRGAVYQGGKLVGRAKLTQISIGFQAGGQSYREIVFFENSESLERFKDNRVELSAQVSAVAAAAGASADAKYVEGVAVFTMQKGGLMYEASVGGQKFKFEPN